MAVLDRSRDAVVLRVVYDGPGEAGKTTTMGVLGAELGRALVTPEERDGRTLYFDWLEYTAGGFEGHALCCQVVSVPGQAEFAQRRAYLLSTADAIIYVAPITRANLDPTLQALRSLCKPRGGLPMGVVLQANKRDLPDALPASRIRSALAAEELPVVLVESTATEGVGIRHAFVMAVRFALDRVREAWQRGVLLEGAPEIDNPQGLMMQMIACETPSAVPATSGAVVGDTSVPVSKRPAARSTGGHAPGGTSGRLRRPKAVEPKGPPALPDLAIPSGSIWPPVIGRSHLSDALASVQALGRTGSAWRATADSGWILYSTDTSQVRDKEVGRAKLVELARLHVEWARILSAPRCLLLADDGRGGARLWQVIRERLSLRGRLQSARCITDEMASARLLVDTVQRLLELTRALAAVKADSSLVATLDTAGVFCRKTQYVGAVGWPTARALPRQASGATRDELIEALQGWPIAAVDLVRASRAIAAETPQLALAVTTLTDLLMKPNSS